jgi:flagellar hook protein FlgE
MNSAGYLVNSAGQYLNGWNVNSATGVADQTSLAPIQVSQTAYNPVQTANVDLSANLPATPTSGTGTSANPITSDVQIYDSLGTAQTVQLNWVQNASNDWTVSIVAPTNTDGNGNLATAVGSAEVQFGPVTSNQSTISAGTIGNFGGSFGGNQSGSSNITTSSFTLGTPATISFSLNYGNGFQPITLSLGNFGSSSGVTQYAGTTYDLRGITQDGVAPGQFSGVTTKSNGDIVLNYSNGQTKTFAQVPLATFNNPDALQRHDGQTFTSTESSGNPLLQQEGTNGAGNLVTNSTEGSNVDIATEFSKLIVAQQAYTANAKVVTTANQLLTTTIDMKQ